MVKVTRMVTRAMRSDAYATTMQKMLEPFPPFLAAVSEMQVVIVVAVDFMLALASI